MKIAIAMENFSRYGGGAESYAVQLAEMLISKGWDVHLYGYSWDGSPSTAIFHKIERLPKWIPPAIRIIHFALAHRKMVRQEQFDVILGFGNTLIMNVYQSHGGVHFRSSMRKTLAIRNPLARLLKKVGMFVSPKFHARAWIESSPFRSKPRPIIVAISDMVRQDMAEHFGVPEHEIQLVYNGIDVAHYSAMRHSRSSSLRQKLGFDTEVLFLFMAYDFRKKGVRYLIEATGELRNRVGNNSFGVIVVGGSPTPSLKRLVRRNHLEDMVVFQPPTKEPESYYTACDVFILPTFYDACSLVVFEAMAGGLPAITTRFNGAAGIISQGKDGMVLQNPSDIKEMSEAMKYFLDPAQLTTASSAARKIAAQYSLGVNHKKMLTIFEQAAAANKLHC
jgi:UDP-glucose:(heptosyl)LPS alpha-1,3-glucosyltransferase